MSDFKDYLSVMACPDCRGELEEITAGGTTGFCCRKCRLVYPVAEGIPVLLGQRSRNYNLESPLLQEMERQPGAGRNLQDCLENTRRLLESGRGQKSWEWEDEEYWAGHYAAQLDQAEAGNWNDRTWQREFLVGRLAARTDLKGKTILDIGCGEGQNFRLLLARYSDAATLYIATDISLDGLKLNRARNPHEKSLYVLCSADALPFKPGVIDCLCYFGILHHTERKAATVPRDSELLKIGGFIIIHEAVAKASRLAPAWLKQALARLWGAAAETSAHEENVDRKDLLRQIAGAGGLEVIAARGDGGLFYFEMMRFFRRPLTSHKRLFLFVMGLNNLLAGTLGLVLPPFANSGIRLLVMKRG